MACELDPINREHLIKTCRFTTSEKEFDCLLDPDFGRKAPTLICEGDSWFSYPRSKIFLGEPANIIDHLALMGYFNILQLSSPGDEAVGMLSGASLREIDRLLVKYGDEIDFFLFSGGGNDIVGAGDMERFLNNSNQGSDFMGWINMNPFNQTIEDIKAAYLRLIDLSKKKSPKCKIITHTYRYPHPNNVGGAFLGGLFKTKAWIKPYMDQKGITHVTEQESIIRYMINRFAEMLLSLPKDNLIVLDIRNDMQKKDWLNEIHLNPAAYARVAAKFLKQII
ncbi:MAG: SGNH/GDSL hydrolase family protein [Magnetococcales bacterium]|nr:SGNH/GDSL hydrolase family protein [Magnetococcales bacterium]